VSSFEHEGGGGVESADKHPAAMARHRRELGFLLAVSELEDTSTLRGSFAFVDMFKPAAALPLAAAAAAAAEVELELEQAVLGFLAPGAALAMDRRCCCSPAVCRIVSSSAWSATASSV
jgi:hypothetical protein